MGAFDWSQIQGADAPAGSGSIDWNTVGKAAATIFPSLASDPTADMSTLDRLGAGIGMGMSKVGRAVGQAIGSGIDAIAPTPLSQRMGLPNQADIDESARLDKPLANTTAGKVGDVMGQTAAVLPAVLIPGANTYLGAGAIGAGIGALTTPGSVGDRAIGAGFGAAGGLAGKGLGDALGYGFNWLADRNAAAQAANAGRDAAAVAARNAGYVIPPADTNPTMTNEILNGIAGKIKTAQTASAQNQTVTNSLAKSAIGAPADEPLSMDILNGIRKQAGQNYQAVASTGTVTPGPSYGQAIDNILAPFKQAAAGFPNAKPNPVIADIEALRSPSFDAGSAVAKISELRDAANSAYASGNNAAGKALKGGAGALEDALDQHLQDIGAPADVLSNFRNARQLIAKTYSVQQGLNAETGDVAAKAMAKQLANGKPLSGDLLTVAQAATAFPKATQTLAEAPKQFSPLDFMTALLAADKTGHLSTIGIPLVRPVVRAGVLSGPYQRTLGVPSYQPGLLGGLLQNTLTAPQTLQAAPTIGGLLGSRFAPQPVGQ